MGLNRGGIIVQKICLCRDTYAEAEYFTWNSGTSNCMCKPDNNLDETRQVVSETISGNVNCYGEFT